MAIDQQATAVIKVSPETDIVILSLLAECNGLRDYAELRIVATNDDVKSATDDLTLIAKLKKTLEEKRKEYISPINAHLKSINDSFKVLMTPVEQADQVTRNKILAFRQEQERKAREVEEINRLRIEAAKREAAMNNGGIKESVNLVEAPTPAISKVYTEGGSLGTMKVRKWEVEDLSKIPTDYLMVDAAKVGKVVRAGIPSIPGIKIWIEETLKVSTR